MATTDTVLETCRDCGEPGMRSGHDVICPNCAAVLDDSPIDPGPEWRSLGDDGQNDRQRTGPGRDATMHDKNLGSDVGHHSEREGTILARANRYHNQAKCDKRDRRRAAGCVEIRRMTTALDLGDDLGDQACDLWQQAYDADLAIGRSIDRLAAAAVWVTSRIHGRGITAEDVADVSHANTRMIHRRATLLQRKLGVEVPPPPLPARVRRVSADLGVDIGDVEDAVELAKRVEGQVVGSPSGVAAAVLYESLGGRQGSFSQEGIGEAAGVSATTVRKRWKDVQGV